MGKVTSYTEDTAPTADDVIYVVNDPGGTPGSKKVTLGNLSKAIHHGDLVGLTDDDHSIYYNLARHTKAIHDTLALDHGSLSGIANDDHTIYTKADGTRAFTGVVSGVSPTAAAHLATKDYVDMMTSGIGLDAVLSRWDASGGLPLLPTTGDRYLCKVAGTGWTLHYIYEYNGATWDATVPSPGDTVLVIDEASQYGWTGVTWISMAATDHGSLGGLSDDDHTQYAKVAGATFTGKLITVLSALGGAGFNLPHGAAPTSPVNGDVWTTTSGLYARINGATLGPYSTGGPPGGTNTAIQYNDSGSFGGNVAKMYYDSVSDSINFDCDLIHLHGTTGILIEPLLQIGESAVSKGTLRLVDSSFTFASILTTTAQTANITYTLPANPPAANAFLMAGATNLLQWLSTDPTKLLFVGSVNFGWAGGTIAAHSYAETTYLLTGCLEGDLIIVKAGFSPQTMNRNLVITGYVSTPNYLTIVFHNVTAASVATGSATVIAKVFR